MDAAVLYSGGKDSTLAAILLEPFFDVRLVSGTWGVTDAADHGEAAAAAVGFPHETVGLDREVADEAVERMVADGYPRNGIQRVHEHALELLAAGEGDDAASGFDVLADGTRRDDRAPTVDRSLAQSVEDRHGVEYVAPLAGYGRGAIDRLVADRLTVETGPSEDVAKADYETELRAIMREAHGDESVAQVFPDHTQSRVVGRR